MRCAASWRARMDGMTTHEPSRSGQRESEREREREREREKERGASVRLCAPARHKVRRSGPRGNTVLSCVASTRLTGLS